MSPRLRTAAITRVQRELDCQAEGDAGSDAG